MRSFYLGIDGGQSGTQAVIADETGRIVGHGTGGPCNHVKGPDGRTKFTRAVGECLQQACRQAHVDPATTVFASTCLGFSGGAEDKAEYSRALIHSLKYKITHDAEIALIGATAGEPGIIVIGGTGSMAYGCNSEGRSARAGGWGYIFGDEGGAFDLTRRALRAILALHEGWGPETKLRKELLDATNAKDANDLLHRFYTADFNRSKIAALAPIVTQAASDGDQVALSILQQASEQLAQLAHAVYLQLFSSGTPVPIVPIGGVFESELLRSTFAKCVQRSMNCTTESARYSPAAGATLEALRLDGNMSVLIAP